MAPWLISEISPNVIVFESALFAVWAKAASNQAGGSHNAPQMNIENTICRINTRPMKPNA